MRVRVDSFAETLPPCGTSAVVVAVDVIRSTTTAISAVVAGHRCFVVPTLEAAVARREELGDGYLVGELGGNMPFGFDATNSPVAVTQLAADRPIVLLSSSGTRLMTAASEAGHRTDVASLRNWRSEVERLQRDGSDEVLLLGAATRGEFRDEDQLCCAWIAGALVEAGAQADAPTRELVTRWAGASPEAIREGKSAAYLVASGQIVDLEYILRHVADVDACFTMRGDEVCREPDAARGADETR
jgi:2-phosphosulfolactate phosphatase